MNRNPYCNPALAGLTPPDWTICLASVRQHVMHPLDGISQLLMPP